MCRPGAGSSKGVEFEFAKMACLVVKVIAIVNGKLGALVLAPLHGEDPILVDAVRLALHVIKTKAVVAIIFLVTIMEQPEVDRVPAIGFRLGYVVQSLQFKLVFLPPFYLCTIRQRHIHYEYIAIASILMIGDDENRSPLKPCKIDSGKGKA